MAEKFYDALQNEIFVGDKIYTDKINEGQSHYYIVDALGVDNPEFPEHSVNCSSTDPEDVVTHIFKPVDVIVASYSAKKEFH